MFTKLPKGIVMNTTPTSTSSLLTSTAIAISLLAIFGLQACDQKGPAEKAGAKIDLAAEKGEKKIELLTEKAGQKLESAKQAVDQKTEAAKESINESSAASESALENAGDKLNQVTETAEQKIEAVKDSVTDKTKSLGDYVGDSVITANVKSSLANDHLFKTSHIEVTTVEGVVKLSGTVDSEPLIAKAMEVAGSQKQVKSVQSGLVVGINPPSKE